ncbi:unnamed protein product, partial [Adineta steineri]
DDLDSSTNEDESFDQSQTANNDGSSASIPLFTIERIHYSLIDTPSHLRAVSEKRQEQFYDENLRKRTIKFHYLNNEIFDENEYTMHLRQCEDLARIIMQLKALNNDYPDEAKLQKIVQQNFIQHYGQTVDREIQTLQGTPDVKAVTIYENNQQ